MGKVNRDDVPVRLPTPEAVGIWYSDIWNTRRSIPKRFGASQPAWPPNDIAFKVRSTPWWTTIELWYRLHVFPQFHTLQSTRRHQLGPLPWFLLDILSAPTLPLRTERSSAESILNRCLLSLEIFMKSDLHTLVSPSATTFWATRDVLDEKSILQ